MVIKFIKFNYFRVFVIIFHPNQRKMDVPPLSNKDLITNNMIKYYDDLDYKLQKGLVRYTSSEYSSLNTLLRDGLNPSNPNHKTSYPNEIDWVNQLDKVISNSPRIKNPFYVYRGMILSDMITDYIKTNGYLNNLGYTSTTFDINTAMGFAGSSCCLFKIIVPNPRDIDYVFIKTRTKGEQEILFQRGTYFKLLSAPYKYKYYPPKSNNYKLITLYTVTINKGIIVPTPLSLNKYKNSENNTLTSFVRYIELMEPEDIDIFYEDNDDIPVEIVNDYIIEHPHHAVTDDLKNIMIGIARQTL